MSSTVNKSLRQVTEKTTSGRGNKDGRHTPTAQAPHPAGSPPTVVLAHMDSEDAETVRNDVKNEIEHVGEASEEVGRPGHVAKELEFNDDEDEDEKEEKKEEVDVVTLFDDEEEKKDKKKEEKPDVVTLFDDDSDGDSVILDQIVSSEYRKSNLSGVKRLERNRYLRRPSKEVGSDPIVLSSDESEASALDDDEEELKPSLDEDEEIVELVSLGRASPQLSEDSPIPSDFEGDEEWGNLSSDESWVIPDSDDEDEEKPESPRSGASEALEVKNPKRRHDDDVSDSSAGPSSPKQYKSDE